MSLLDDVAEALEQGDLPLELAVPWTEYGLEEWEASWDPKPMLRILVYVDRPVAVLVACECARTVLPLVPEGENQTRQAIEVAEAWARGVATLQEVATARNAASSAYATYIAADDWDAAHAADAAASAASVVVYSSSSARAYAAAYSARYTDAASATAYLALLADLVRSIARCPTAQEFAATTGAR